MLENDVSYKKSNKNIEIVTLNTSMLFPKE